MEDKKYTLKSINLYQHQMYFGLSKHKTSKIATRPLQVAIEDSTQFMYNIHLKTVLMVHTS